ncbi:MAG: hypothetical protein IKW58_03110 [Alphaproteobacteria bacterium]|nr:hypothetical protein [Alphaproteobacteria bacterium]
MHITQNISKLYKISVILSILITIATVYISTFLNEFCLDEFEHLQVSFNIAKDQVPYRDFFEHHHGLLWYIGAFLLHPFFNDAIVLYLARIIGLIIFLSLLFSMYKLCRLFSISRLASLLAPLLYANIRNIQENAINYRPDTLMTLFFMIGLIYFFKYLSQKSFHLLFVSFLMFFFSFMSLQKVLAPLVGVFFCIVYLIIRKQILLKDVLKALYIPFLLYLSYLTYLYKIGSLQDYWESCWILNFHLKIVVSVKSYFIVPVSCLLTIYLITSKKFSHSIKLYSAIVLCNIAMIVTVFKLYNPQYEIQPYALFMVVFAISIDEVVKKYKKIASLMMLLLPIMSLIVFINAYQIKKGTILAVNVALNSYIISVSSPSDYIINNFFVGGIRHYATGYYWFEYFATSRIHQHLFPRRSFPELNLIIKARKPKVVLKDATFPNCLNDNYIPTRNCKVVDKIDPKNFGNQYVDMGFIYVRK